MKAQFSLAALAVALSAAPAFAEDQSEDTVVVTGVRAPSLLERLPATLDVIDRAELDLNTHITLVEALSATPGLAMVQSGPAGSTASVFVRGSNSKHILALYDGIRLNDVSASNGAFNFGSDLVGDAGRIELVRGPLSSLYGSDAVGGVVNILPRRAPESGSELYGEASVGAFNTYRALLGGGVREGRFNFAATAEYQESDGYDVTPDRISTSTGDPDPSQFSVLSANGGFALTEALSVEALIRHRESEVDFDTFSGGPTGFQRADDTDLRSEDSQSLWSLGLVYARPSNDFQSRLRAGRVEMSLDSFNNGAVTDEYAGERDFAQWSNVWTPDALSSLIDPVVSFGIEYQDETAKTDTAFNAPLSVSEDLWSAYAAVQAGLTARFDITGSIRFDDYEAFGDQTTYNLGAVYRLDALNTRLRASYGTSFKAPSLSERFSSSAFVSANPDLQPEEGETFEIGFDSALALAGREAALRFGAVWYDTEIKDLIEYVYDGALFIGQNRNVGEADLQGYEVFAQWSPVDQASVRVDYTYTDAQNATTGAQLLRRPEDSFAVTGTWRPIEIASLSATWRHVGERLDVTYDDSGFFTSSAGQTPSYETVDLTGTLDVYDRLQLVLGVRNLLDETYEPVSGFAGAPRAVTFGVRLRP
ncbi:TonB-dependent receptor domain-containing protein [Oceanicaulis sp.]|uniref:TonB-dependent receptor domain-containing protein n=1 Tax=Oceanicaulis sp. TaxID=1924941 RepID=UPI003BAD24A7